MAFAEDTPHRFPKYHRVLDDNHVLDHNQTSDAPIINTEPAFVISCDTCVMKDTDACSDCMMTFLCDRPDDGAVILNLQELREVKLLAKAGLVPTLRHRGVG